MLTWIVPSGLGFGAGRDVDATALDAEGEGVVGTDVARTDVVTRTEVAVDDRLVLELSDDPVRTVADVAAVDGVDPVVDVVESSRS